MVLALRIAPIFLLAACSTSLFDHQKHLGGGSGDDDAGPVAMTCGSPCFADAAADFDGTPTGATKHWRYVEDHRDRTWAAMTGDAHAMTGQAAGNQISTCADHAGAAACTALPGALLISSAGATSPADPALELTVPSNQELSLSLHAFVPTGSPEQQIRIYRNSREDALYTTTATAGAVLEQKLTFDAIAGDRFLVALVPTDAGASNVALQVFANPTMSLFPSLCQLGVTFETATGNTVANACGAPFTHALFDGDKDTAPVLAAGPYPELGKAADFVSDQYFYSNGVINRSGDTTLQFWLKFRSFIDGYDAWPFSDLDLNQPGGLAVALTVIEPLRFDAQTTTMTDPTIESVDGIGLYPTDGAWHFLRVTQTGGNVYVCLDGKRQASYVLAAGHAQSTFSPWFGANQRWSPQGAHFDGLLDDVRILNQALPCDP